MTDHKMAAERTAHILHDWQLIGQAPLLWQALSQNECVKLEVSCQPCLTQNTIHRRPSDYKARKVVTVLMRLPEMRALNDRTPATRLLLSTQASDQIPMLASPGAHVNLHSNALPATLPARWRPHLAASEPRPSCHTLHITSRHSSFVWSSMVADVRSPAQPTVDDRSGQ